MTASELSQEGNVLVIDDQGFHPSTIVVNHDSCDTGGCSATFDVVNEGTTTHTFTIDDNHFPPDWLSEYGPIDSEIAPGETAGGSYVSFLPGDAQELNPDTLEFYCRLHPSLRGHFVEGE
jgi:hypothetical protein